MKQTFRTLVLLSLTAIATIWDTQASAQITVEVPMDISTNGTTVIYNSTETLIISDDNYYSDSGYYSHGNDYTLTIEGGCPGGLRLGVMLYQMDISCLDTLYVYDGPDTNGNLRAKINNSTDWQEGDFVVVGPANTTGQLTLRFRTDPRTDTSRTHLPCASIAKGFKLLAGCYKPCERMVPVIDTLFLRTRGGHVYDTSRLRWVEQIDTTYGDPCRNESPDSMRIDTTYFLGANLCMGDGIILTGRGEYTHHHGYYDPSDSTTYFIWAMGNDNDTLRGFGLTEVSYEHYRRLKCSDVSLKLIDAYGCESRQTAGLRVRISDNPIKTVYSLEEICNSQQLRVNTSYRDDNATIRMQHIRPDSISSKRNPMRVFIPDGGTSVSSGCPSSYYEAPVTFSEFPGGKVLESADEICSICIDIEHSFMGDIALSIVCPTGQEAFLKYGQYTTGRPSGPGAETGGGTYLGFPIEDGEWDNSPTCDSTVNPYGIGLEYCFSRNRRYTLVTGDSANFACDSRPNGPYYLGSSGYQYQATVTFPPVAPGFNTAGQVPPSRTITTKMPSNYADSSNYYLPYTSFNELVGCPLNGTWNLRVYDDWSRDNGWVFGWTMDICNHDDCDYEVKIDSVIWMPDPSDEYHDYDLGHYRGLTSTVIDSTTALLATPDTAGTFPVLVKVYDNFGCLWDTTTHITTYWTPTPNLGSDTALCLFRTIKLDASDRHTATENYTYLWSPGGETTPSIETQREPTADVQYVVEATNHRHTKVCSARDTLLVKRLRQPLPAIAPLPSALEGCAPLTIQLENLSVDANQHYWDFGDGNTSTLAAPVHTWDRGVYDLRYVAVSADGCVDSIVAPQAVAAFTAPEAAFEWEPVYPSATQPVVHLTNRTTPDVPENSYRWEVQYNAANPLSVETLTDHDAVFDFSQYATPGASIAGSYAARLIASANHVAPSGNPIACRDTAENSILVLDDYLQFPNVVTPNGDGVNDRFVIHNLLEGKAFPENSLDIYNAWGVRVFHLDNIASEADFWDPSGLPAGTYFFRFSGRGLIGAVEHIGVIEVIKN